MLGSMMSSGTVYLFPDTNVFIQCKPLEEVDWSLLGDWQHIELVVSAPVVAELDSLKGKGNNRQASRARAANTLLGRLLEEGVDFIALPTTPRVHLSVRVELGPDPEAGKTLPNSRDNELVGIARGFAASYPDAQVRLLTNDNGPMFSARKVGLQYLRVPGGWLLPPEGDEADKREKELLARISSLEKSEPRFDIELSGAHVHDGRLKASLTMYSPLAGKELERLLTRMTELHPLATNFGPTEPQERPVKSDPYGVVLYGLTKEVFTPASSEEIGAYREAHRAWLKKCEEILKSLHIDLNSQVERPLVTASIGNTGSRPAEHALVDIEVQGDLLLLVPNKSDVKDEEASTSNDAPRLPQPPAVPQGHWRAVRQSSGLMDLTARVTSITRELPEGLLDAMRVPRLVTPEPPDPNAVYWKDGRPGRPGKKFVRTCEQWRHAVPAKAFGQHILCRPTAGEHSGLLTVTVHAANLTAPAIKRLPIRLTVREASCLDVAVEMVEDL